MNLYPSPLHFAIAVQDVELTKLLVHSEKTDINQKDENGESLLHVAVRNSNLAIVQILIDAGANVNQTDEKENLPIEETSNSEMIQLLLKSGSNPKKTITIENDREKGNIELKDDANKNLIHQIDHEIIDDDEEYLLHQAIKNGDDELAERLIDFLKNNSDINSTDDDGLAPIHYAAMKGNEKICRLLLQARGVEVNIKDDKQQTPLHYAVNSGNLSLCKFLIEANACVNIPDEDNLTPLHYALINNNLELYELLVQNGAVEFDLPNVSPDRPSILNLYLLKKLKIELKTLPAYEHLTKMIFTPKAKALGKEVLARKMLSHAFEVKGSTAFLLEKKPTEMSLEGFFSNPLYFLKKFSKNILSFQTSFPHLIDSQAANTIHAICKTASENLSIEEKFNRWKQGEPVIIDSGYFEHHVSILFWNDQIIVCNRGGGKGQYKAFEAFKSAEITVELFETFQQTSVPKEFFQAIIASLVPDPEVSESLATLEIPSQKIGNCGWADTEGLILPLMILNKCKQNYPDLKTLDAEKIHEIGQEQKNIFENWRSAHKLVIVQKYLRAIHEKRYPPDIQLLSRAILDDCLGTEQIDLRLKEQWKATKLDFLSLVSKEEYARFLTEETASKIAEMKLSFTI